MSVEQVAALLFVAAIVSMTCRKFKIPYTVGLTVAGFVLALLPTMPDMKLTKQLIFTAFLPPLIFEAAYQIHWPELRRDLALVHTMATFGVVASIGVFATGVHALLGWNWPMCLILGVLISATDPVSVIATFKETRVSGRLKLLLEAESLFNDGTAAVLFSLVLAYLGGTVFDPASSFLSLFLKVGGGALCGIIVGGIALFLSGQTEDPLVELTFTTIAAYASFLIAENLQLSGVLATLSVGILLGNYGSLGAFSHKGREAVVSFWEYAAFVANSLIFLLIGLRLAHRSLVPVWFSLVAVILFALAGRAVSVYGCCLAFCRSRLRVEMAHQHMLFWGGLRGALCLALVLALPSEIPWRETAINMVFGVVAFSVLVQGLTIMPLIKKLGLDAPTESA